jgi:hypothetical protein
MFHTFGDAAVTRRRLVGQANHGNKEARTGLTPLRMAGLLLAGGVSPELIGTSFECIRTPAVALIELAALDAGA